MYLINNPTSFLFFGFYFQFLPYAFTIAQAKDNQKTDKVQDRLGDKKQKPN